MGEISPDGKKMLIIFGVILLLAFGYSSTLKGKTTVKQTVLDSKGCMFNAWSLDSASYKMHDTVFDGKESIILTGSVSTENECVYGYWDDKDISSELEDEEKAVQYDFKLKLDSKAQQCIYAVDRQYVGESRGAYKSVYKITATEMPWSAITGPGLSDVINQCKAKDKYYMYIPSPPGIGGHILCLTLTRDGYYGRLSDPSLNFPVEIKVEGKENLPPATVAGNNETHAWIGDRVYVVFDGYLLGNVFCPISDAQQRVAIYAKNPDTNRIEWFTVEKNDWDNYETYDESGFQACVNSKTWDPLAEDHWWQYRQCINEYNARAYKVLNRPRAIKWTWNPKGYEQLSSGNEGNGRIILDTDKQIVYPVLTFHVDAVWMGIYSPIGKPEIVSYPENGIDVRSGGTPRYVNVRVKNIGGAEGSFDVRMECSSGFSAGPNPQSEVYRPNQTITSTFRVEGWCNNDVTGSCTISAKGKKYQDVVSMPIRCSPEPICDPEGKKRCSDDKARVEICRNGNWNTSEECEFGCVEDGAPHCKVLKCTSDIDCDDNDPCTLDKCVVDLFGNARCTNDNIPNCGICGNGICEPLYGENYENCQIDCKSCGNGVCEIGENNNNCEVDCPAICGNGICEKGETQGNCPDDCSGGCDTSKCSWWDIGCFINEGLICPLVQAAQSVFMWIGIIIVVIIILVIAIKVMFRRSPREYIPFYGRRW